MAERAHQLAPTDAVTHFVFSIGLLQTLQVKRLAEEGSDFYKIDGLYWLGRRDEAFELAFELSRYGYLMGLFRLLNQADRSKELIDYLEERWPSVNAFAADYPHNEFGYTLMADVALAYYRTGNTERFDDALLLFENALSNLSAQGIDNFVFDYENAKYRSLAGEYDEALTHLESAIDRGFRAYALFETESHIFEPLRDDPRFITAKAVMVDNINVERNALGLAPIDPAEKFRH